MRAGKAGKTAAIELRWGGCLRRILLAANRRSLFQDHRGEFLAVGAGKAGETQGRMLLRHCRCGIRPGQALRTAQAGGKAACAQPGRRVGVSRLASDHPVYRVEM